MIKNDYSGLFIAVEGIDGSGSSTQTRLLEEWLRGAGLPVLSTKEPTNSVIGGAVRSALTGELTYDERTLQLLFCADRSNHLVKQVVPNLQKSRIVVTDRYLWSTLAYGAVNLNFDWLLSLNSLFIQPDLTFYLRISSETAEARLNNSRLELEYFERQETLNKVSENYGKIIKLFPGIIDLDGQMDIKSVHEEIKRFVSINDKYRLIAGAKLI